MTPDRDGTVRLMERAGFGANQRNSLLVKAMRLLGAEREACARLAEQAGAHELAQQIRHRKEIS